MQKKIVITGGPGTGKTAIINQLIKLGYNCMQEVSREVTEQARKEGFEQLFLAKPLLFSELLLKGRIKQFNNAELIKNDLIFFDRGIPDVSCYLDFKNEAYHSLFKDANKKYKYHTVFILPPWEEIYTSDNIRYESYKESVEIYEHLKAGYSELGYDLIEVPKGSVEERIHFILEAV